ncbi:MAG: radical SAM protein [Promethearchaeati archaeon SRVP18_Atabeyarchaeia-1]
MVKKINLSSFFPIRAGIEDGKISILLHGIIAGEISLSQLRALIRRQLAAEQLELDVLVSNGELMITVNAEPKTIIDEQKVAEVAGNLISRLLPPTLRNRVTGKKLVYITTASGIPLMGRIDFGIIDRGTNLIQVRPITGCVLDCPFCSVDSGLSSRTRVTDFIVDKDYLVEEVRKLCEFKGSESIELHIDGQGEPTLYPYLPALVEALSKISGVDTVSLQTNGASLTERLVDDLQKAGLSRINLSLNALDSHKATVMSGTAKYDLTHILDVTEYIRDSKIALLVAPLWLPGLNDDEIPRILQFVKKIGIRSKWPVLGIQNYLIHRRGRRVKGIKPCSMAQFRHKLRNLASSFSMPNLVLRRSDFGITPMESYDRPFKIGETAEIDIVAPGRMIGEMVGVGRERALHVLTFGKTTGIRKSARILRTKHNIFVAEAN